MTVWAIVYSGYERDWNGVWGIYSSEEGAIAGRLKDVVEFLQTEFADVDVGEFDIEEWEVK